MRIKIAQGALLMPSAPRDFERSLQQRRTRRYITVEAVRLEDKENDDVAYEFEYAGELYTVGQEWVVVLPPDLPWWKRFTGGK